MLQYFVECDIHNSHPANIISASVSQSSVYHTVQTTNAEESSTSSSTINQPLPDSDRLVSSTH